MPAVDEAGKPARVPREEIRAARREALRYWRWRLTLGVGLAVAADVWRSQDPTFTTGRQLVTLGLALDILGVWMLARGVLFSDDDLAGVGTAARSATVPQRSGTAKRPGRD
jgi:hypothetical protein